MAAGGREGALRPRGDGPTAVVLVPELRPGRGIGHAVRLLRHLPRASVHVATAETQNRLEVICERIGVPFPNTVPGEFEPHLSDLVVVDALLADNEARDLYRRFRGATVLAVDAGPVLRDCAPLVFDFATPVGSAPPNKKLSALPEPPINLPTTPRGDNAGGGMHGRDMGGGPPRILVTFGGDDPAGLTAKAQGALAHLADATFPKPAVETLDAAESKRLPWALAEYDLVVTSFGMTALEAAELGVPVVTINPTPYHDRMSAAHGLFCAGTDTVDEDRLAAALADPARAVRRLHGGAAKRRSAPAGDRPATLGDLISRLDVSGHNGCPVCRRKENQVCGRHELKTFYTCGTCGTWYMENFCAKKTAYDNDYFFSSYKEQYGRSYLDDFDHIKGMGAARVEAIRAFQKSPGARAASRAGAAQNAAHARAVLDIGCAYGPFLAAAKDAGFVCYGVDVNADAAEYVQSRLGIPAVATDLRDFDPERAFGRSRFDVVTAWYVIEHFPVLTGVLEKLVAMLEPKGVLALSTPNGAGISARSDTQAFMAGSPDDHFSIWTPAQSRVILRRFGLSRFAVRVTGHHPERFPQRRMLPKRLLAAYSRLRGLGDTFEVYAARS